MPSVAPGEDQRASSIPRVAHSSAPLPGLRTQHQKADDVTVLSIEAPAPDLAPLTAAPSQANWTAGCTVARRGPLTTLALDGDLGAADIPGLDRAAALAIDLPGLEVLVVDLSDLHDLGPELAQWLLRVQTWVERAGASMVVLAEPGSGLSWLRTPEASSLRVLRGSASFV